MDGAFLVHFFTASFALSALYELGWASPWGVAPGYFLWRFQRFLPTVVAAVYTHCSGTNVRKVQKSHVGTDLREEHDWHGSLESGGSLDGSSVVCYNLSWRVESVFSLLCSTGAINFVPYI